MILIKITITDQIKILNKKIFQNEAQYDLGRKAAIISAQSSKNLDKVAYLTSEDLGLKPNTIEQARFEYSPLGNIFNKGLDKDDQKEGLFKRLKNIENAQKNVIRNDDNEIYTPRSEFDDKDEKEQSNNIDTIPSNIFNYLKSLSPEANDLIDEIEEDDDDIDINKLAFINSNQEKFNFNTFRMPLNFLSAIYNGETSLNEAEMKQRDLEKEIGDLEFGYKSKDKKEKKEKIQVLMHANELLESRNKIIKAFKDDIFPSEHFKKSDDTAYNYMLKNVNEFIEEIKSMEEKINSSLF